MLRLPVSALLLCALCACSPSPCARSVSCCEAFVAETPDFSLPKRAPKNVEGLVEELGGVRLKGVRDRCRLRSEGLLSRKECRELNTELNDFHRTLGEPWPERCSFEDE